MSSNSGLVVFIFIIALVGGFSVFYTFANQRAPIPLRMPNGQAVSCSNEWSTISFLIKEHNGEKSLIMNGKSVPTENLKLFNSTAVSGEWRADKSGTKFFLDRISARLELETTDDFDAWEKNIFTCKKTQIRF